MTPDDVLQTLQDERDTLPPDIAALCSNLIFEPRDREGMKQLADYLYGERRCDEGYVLNQESHRLLLEELYTIANSELSRGETAMARTRFSLIVQLENDPHRLQYACLRRAACEDDPFLVLAFTAQAYNIDPRNETVRRHLKIAEEKDRERQKEESQRRAEMKLHLF